MNLPKTMKALQLRKIGALDAVELSVPRPGPEEVLVQTGAAVICTSDLNDMNYNPFGIELPRVLGHEGAGRIALLGDKVKGFKAGERVTVHPVIPCRECDSCKRGIPHLCERMGHLGCDRDGTFAEYFCIRADRIRRVPDDMDIAVSALMEPVAVCLESLERARVSPGDNVLIVGDGPFGIITARLAFAAKPAKVILTGHHDFRLNQVQEAVRIHSHSLDETARAVLEATNGRGVDAAILAVGREDAVDLCIRSLRARGRLVIFSAIAEPAKVNLFKVHVKELELLGACNDANLLDESLKRLADPGQNLASLITHRLPFAEWARGIELAAKGKQGVLKVAFTFGGQS